MNAYDEFIALFAQDVRRNPTAYKLSVSANPEAAAKALIDGLDDAETRQMLRDMKAEIRACSRV